MPAHPPNVEIVALTELDHRFLHLDIPPFRTAHDAFWQLRKVIKTAESAGAQSIAVERHYIDRDYIEDHSVFYAKSLHDYGNSCQRVQFFRSNAETVARSLLELAERARSEPDGYREACRNFSRSEYLGFCVIKPLRGSPVGRTVLAAPSGVLCGQDYKCHLLGVELSVRGVPFQQQDVGVSACATTALWSSLRVLSGLEPIAPATPAQITTLAVKYYLPLGRAMPQSEGLNIGQMCQAIEALGVSPMLLHPEDPEDTLGILHSILQSRIAPILLIVERGPNAPNPPASHAVTATGFEKDDQSSPLMEGLALADPGRSMRAIFLHDDRIGPYVRAVLDRPASTGKLLIHIPGGKPDPQTFSVDHILVPVHAKVRLSFASLRILALDLAAKASEVVAFQTTMLPGADGDPPVAFEAWISRTHKYIETLLRRTATPVAAVRELSAKCALPRYLGIVRLSASYLGPIDILIDTTSTMRNPHGVGVVVLGQAGGLTTAVASELATALSSDQERVPLVSAG